MGRLDGKVAIITGGASGQGAEEVRLFTKEGAKVVATDLQEEKLNKVVEDVKKAGGDAIAITHDITSEQGWVDVVKKTVDTYGSLNILVNNAGVFSAGNAEETTLEDWNKVMSINAGGAFLGTKYSIPEMRKAGGGSIVNISSISGILGFGAAAYNASKGAMRTFTKNVAADYAKENIRVNSIHPGVIVSPMTNPILEVKESRENFENMTPMPRLGEPIDIAYGALYLASDEASFMTGSELVIDGGIVACKGC